MTKCPHPRCSILIKVDHLCCRTHWFQIPAPLRNEVWRTWKARLSESCPETIHAHEAAKAAALATFALPTLGEAREPGEEG